MLQLNFISLELEELNGPIILVEDHLREALGELGSNQLLYLDEVEAHILLPVVLQPERDMLLDDALVANVPHEVKLLGLLDPH